MLNLSALNPAKGVSISDHHGTGAVVSARSQKTMTNGERGTLSGLLPGETATVSRISPGCQGAERRRLVGLGILPGTAVTAEIVSPSGDPTAYRIRGALVALRREQAGLIETNGGHEANAE